MIELAALLRTDWACDRERARRKAEKSVRRLLQ